MRRIGVTLTIACASAVVMAQAPPKRRVQPVPKLFDSAQGKPTGTLAQIMRGIYFPNSNVIFDVQHHDPGAPKKPTDDAASATAAYANAYSGWEVVENAAIALTDGVDLILTPGRRCQNGKPVPLQQADFQKFARNMRTAGLAVFQAARARNQEKVSDATNDLADACSSCHEVYRDRGPADSLARCTPNGQKNP
jgi:cytochrome c556